MKIAPKPQPGQEMSLDELIHGKKNPAPSNPTGLKPSEGIMEFIGDGWRLSPIKMRGGLYTIDLCIGCLDGGKEKTYQEWQSYAIEAQKQGRYYPAAGDALFAIVQFLRANLTNAMFANQILMELKSTIASATEKNKIALLTECSYQPSLAPDIIVHDRDLPSRYIISGRLKGRDTPASLAAKDEEYLNLLLGSRDLERGMKVLKGISPHPVYISRENEQTAPKTSTPLSIYNHSDFFFVDTKDQPNRKFRTLGVIQRARLETKP